MHRKWSVGYRCEEVFVGQSGMLRQFSKVHDNLLELSSDIHHCSEIENIMNDMIDTIDVSTIVFDDFFIHSDRSFI